MKGMIVKSLENFRAVKYLPNELTDNQRIIRDYTKLGDYLEALGDRNWTFYQFAGHYKRYWEMKNSLFKMPSREEFGYNLLVLIQTGFVELS